MVTTTKKITKTTTRSTKTSRPRKVTSHKTSINSNTTAFYSILGLLVLATASVLVWAQVVDTHNLESSAGVTSYIASRMGASQRSGTGESFDPKDQYKETAVSTVPVSASEEKMSQGSHGSEIITGLLTCLPHAGSAQVHTMECALGLRTEVGYFGLDTSGLNKDLWTFGEARVTVKGIQKQIDITSDPQWKSYKVSGVISVLDIAKQ